MPVPPTVFRSNSKFYQNSQFCGLKRAEPITTQFCTWHDSLTVVTCAKFRCDRLNMLWTKALQNFHWISNSIEISLVGRVPGSHDTPRTSHLITVTSHDVMVCQITGNSSWTQQFVQQFVNAKKKTSKLCITGPLWWESICDLVDGPLNHFHAMTPSCTIAMLTKVHFHFTTHTYCLYLHTVYLIKLFLFIVRDQLFWFGFFVDFTLQEIKLIFSRS